jgi:hypothetical protein
MKKPTKRLSLTTQTLRLLDEQQLESVAGGLTTLCRPPPTSANQQSCGGACHKAQ